MEPNSGFICAGNWIVDVIHEIEHWPRESDLTRIRRQSRALGGGPANVAAALVRLGTGLPVWPVGAIGDDEYGAFIRSCCRDLDLPTANMTTRAGTPTAQTHVMTVPGRSRTFFYQGGASDLLSPADFPADLFETAKARIFYLGYPTLLAGLDKMTTSGTSGGETVAAAVLNRARTAGMTTCVDLVSIDRPDFATIVQGTLSAIDFLVVNEVEAFRAAGMPLPDDGQDPSDEALETAARRLVDSGVRRAVIVHCPGTAVWAGAGGEVFRARNPVLEAPEIVSPLGAGDAFCAGLIYAVHESWPPARALDLAHKTARAALAGRSATEAIPRLSELMAR